MAEDSVVFDEVGRLNLENKQDSIVVDLEGKLRISQKEETRLNKLILGFVFV